MKKVLAVLVVLAAFAAPVAAADVSGPWTVNAEIAGNAIGATCTFTQAEKALSGSCASDLGESKTSGTIDGQKVGFQYDISFQGMSFTLAFDGTLDEAAKAIKGTVNVAGAGDGTFTATKK